MTYLYIGIGVVLLLLVLNRKAVGRLWESAAAQFGKLGRSAQAADPAAVWQHRCEKAATELNTAVSGLEEYQGLMTGMQTTVTAEEREEKVLTARLNAQLDKGDEEAAAKTAVDLDRVQKKLAVHRTKLTEYQEGYKAGLKKVKFQRQQILDAQAKGREMGAELKMAKAEAALSDAAAKINTKNGGLDGLGEIEDEMTAQINQNRAKSAVARDLGIDGLAEIEEAEAVAKADSSALLEKFKAERAKKAAE